MTRLFQPFIAGLRNRFLPGGRISMRTGILLCIGIILCGVLYAVSVKTVGYFHRQNELGIILSLKIFQMAWVLMFTMLVFSSMVSGVSALYLSRDNEILWAAPISPAELFSMRYLTTTLYTSWMMVVFSLPVFAAYGTIFNAGILYWPLLFLAVLSTALTATGLGLGATILLVNIFPARKTKDIVMYLSLLFGILLYLMIRLLRPEDLADPDKFPDFLEYLSTLQTPANPLLPPAWSAELLSRYLDSQQIDWLLAGLLLCTPMVCYSLGEWIMTRFFFSGFSKAQESFGGFRSFLRRPYRPSPMLWHFRKELKMFLRDSSEWSQLFLIGALVIVYLYNFKVLPLDRSPMPMEYISNLIAYANIGLTGFLVASLSARFVYPSIGVEGEAFGLIRTAPTGLGRFMLYKYIFYALPFTVLALILLVASNHLLQINGPMFWISLYTGLLITWTVVAMALGFGAVYADFKAENRAATLGGFGAIAFLFSSLSFELLIIGLGSPLAYKIIRGGLQHNGFSVAEKGQALFMLAGLVAVALIISLWSIRWGIRALEKR